MAAFLNQLGWVSWLFVALLVALIMVGVFLRFTVCPRIRFDVSSAIEDGRVVFKLKYSRMVNGVLRFRVSNDYDTFWDLSTSYEKGNQIVYGVLPTGGNMPARQLVPPVGVPLPDIRGRTV